MDMVFYTSNTEHLRITKGTAVSVPSNPDNGAVIETDNLAHFTISNNVADTGYGSFDNYTVLRVIGDSTNDGQPDIIPVAEFRRTYSSGQETDIKIRGQRDQLVTSTAIPTYSAAIMLSNYNDERLYPTNPPVDYPMAKIAAGMERSSGQTGNLCLLTNQGYTLGGLQERARIDNLGQVGINISSPTNRLEIHDNDTTANKATPVTLISNSISNSFTYTPNPLGGTGFSGLRFTDLRALSTPDTVNPGPGVLALDTNGDVIYVPATGTGFGTCSIPTTFPVGVNGAINLGAHNNNFYFEGQGLSTLTSTTNSVGIGYTCGNLNAKLDVLQFSGMLGGTIGINVLNSDNGAISTVTTIGLRSKADGINNFKGDINEGGEFWASNALVENRAGAFFADGQYTGTVNQSNYGVYSIASDAIRNYGGSFKATVQNITSGNNISNTGISVIGSNATYENVGGDFEGFTDPTYSSTHNIGILASAADATTDNTAGSFFASSTTSNGNTYGIYATTSGGTTSVENISGKFYAPSSTTGTNYGIWSQALNGSTNYGIYSYATTGGGNYAGYFDGDVAYTGTLIHISDSILKNNLNNITNASEIINKLNPMSFYFDTINYNYLNLSGKKQYGLIAQQVERVLPEVVFNVVHPEQKDSIGNIISPELKYKGLNYQAFIPLIIQGMKELNSNKDSVNAKLNSRIDSLIKVVADYDSLKNIVASYSSRFDSLEAMINRCCGQNAKATPNGQTGNNTNQSNVQYVKLSTENAIILNQNDPNPFAEETDITYFLPETVGNATIMFYDNTGVIIKSVQLQSKGNGTLHVYASDLSSGMYTYALIVDGKMIDSKKMMKTK
jgi:hypothetical protein